MKEKAYDFRKRLLQVHEPNIRSLKRLPKENELVLENGLTVAIGAQADEVIETAACDFMDFLSVSMGVDSILSIGEDKEAAVTVLLAEQAGIDLGDAAVYRGFLIEIDDDIKIYGYDSRGAAQALYYLEDMMSFAHAPYLERSKIKKHPAFSPQMVHSAYGLDEYPDEYLARIAHEGRDAILVFTKGVNQTPGGYLNFNELISRAKKYGIDVYAYSYLESNMSPEAEEAEEYYEKNYGELFRECPELKGVTLVGESVEFPSCDPHVAKGRYFETSVDGIPSEKRSSGWYPCEDYPIWLNLLKRIIRKYNSEADIVFWTYNWGFQPEEARIKLIESLPTDISLQATFEMFEPRRYGDCTAHCADYTLSFAGPGAYFKSEAEAAKKRGIRLYSMTNTGGLTWDFGVIPYEPMPQQWIKRLEAMRQAKQRWGLCGVMETHHYGFYPSFISKLVKWSCLEPYEDMEDILRQILIGEYGEEAFQNVYRALELWSEAINFYTPTNADQYGAFRVGPSYPFCLIHETAIPSDPKAMFGNTICFPVYFNEADERDSLLSIRIEEEIKCLEIMRELLQEGLQILKSTATKNEKLLMLLNLGKFVINSVKTGIHAKRWYILKNRLLAETTKNGVKEILDDMEKLLRKEAENAENTIPLTEEDSRLGWEPSMLYMTDKWHLEWKIRQINYVLNTEISTYRKCLEK